MFERLEVMMKRKQKKNKFLLEAIGAYVASFYYRISKMRFWADVDRFLQKRIIRRMQNFQSATHKMGDLPKEVVRTVFGKELTHEFLSFVSDTTKTIDQQIQQVFDELDLDVSFVLAAGVDLRTFVSFLIDLANVLTKRKKPVDGKAEEKLIRVEVERLIEVRYPGLHLIVVDQFVAVFDSVDKIVLAAERLRALGLCVGPEYSPSQQSLKVEQKDGIKCYVLGGQQPKTGNYAVTNAKKSRSKN